MRWLLGRSWLELWLQLMAFRHVAGEEELTPSSGFSGVHVPV